MRQQLGRISGNFDAKNSKPWQKSTIVTYIGRCRVRIKEDQKAIWCDIKLKLNIRMKVTPTTQTLSILHIIVETIQLILDHTIFKIFQIDQEKHNDE